LDERVEAFRNRPLEGAYPYLWLDARVERVRDTASGMVRQKALLVAYGVHETGRREVIGLHGGEVEVKSLYVVDFPAAASAPSGSAGWSSSASPEGSVSWAMEPSER
jgi:Transposase, Mutator family